MGKSKKRIFNKFSNEKGSVIKRAEIVKQVLSAIKNNTIDEETLNLLSLFGIKTEELSEAGASFEEISIIEDYIS